MRTIAVLTVAVLAALGFACGSSPSGPSGANGTLSLMLKDSPYTDATALLVTFSEVSAHLDGEGGFTKLTFAGTPTPATRTCDLKQLVDAQDVLGVGTLVAGHYTQLRLMVSSAALYFTPVTPLPAPCAGDFALPAGGTTIDIPSGEVKLNREFDVAAAAATATTILLDFDGDKSVVAMGNGKYRLTPVIGVVSVQQ